MQINIKKMIPIALALLLVTSGAAAAIAWDTETTNTATTSDLSGASNTVSLDPGNASATPVYVEVSGASTENLTLELEVAEPGVNYTAYTNATPDTEDATNGHYSWSVGHDELEDLPRDETGGTYNATVYDDTGTELLNTEVAFDTAGNDDNAVLVVSDDGTKDAAAMTNLVADDLEVTQEKSWFGFGSTETNVSVWSGYTNINGSSSDVTVQLANSSTSSAYETAGEDSNEGDWMRDSTVFINGQPHKVYKGAAPDDVESNDTYAVYDNSKDELTLNLGDDYDKTRTLQVRAAAGQGYSFGELQANFGYLTALESLIPQV